MATHRYYWTIFYFTFFFQAPAQSHNTTAIGLFDSNSVGSYLEAWVNIYEKKENLCPVAWKWKKNPFKYVFNPYFLYKAYYFY